MEKRIFLSAPHMGGEEKKYIQEAFDSNWVAPLGKNVTEFENEICAYVGRPYGVALASGTAAIHLGLKYLGVKEGDIVFCQSMTFGASCNPVVYLGAKPVFIDSEKDTLNMCAAALKKAYEKYPNPKAIIVVNLYGTPAKYDHILPIAREHNTPVLEDAAESLGSTYNGRQTGTFGDISIFSFNGNKIITTSGGGMAVTNSQAAREKMLFWATQAREKAPWYQHEEIGYNYRLSNICAGIGRGQLKVLDERIAQKTKIRNIYKEEFEGNPYISVPDAPDNCKPNYWLTVARLSSKCKATFMDIIEALDKENIESRPAWKPMHMQPVFKDSELILVSPKGSVAEYLFNHSICLPSFTQMTEEEVRYTARIVKKTIEEKQNV